MRGPHDPNQAEVLSNYLDATEGVIRAELKDSRTAKYPERRMELTDALEALRRARAVLADCPDGADLALCVLDVFLSRARPAVADLHAGGNRTGGTAPQGTRQHRIVQRDARLRAKAAKLEPTLTPSAKSKLLARHSRLRPRTIRAILAR